MMKQKYIRPMPMAVLLSRDYYPDELERSGLTVLDLAAGTGQVGQDLFNVGFKHIDAVDASQGMLEQLAKR